MIRYNRIEKMSLGHLVITGMYSKHKLKNFEKIIMIFIYLYWLDQRSKYKLLFSEKRLKKLLFLQSLFLENDSFIFNKNFTLSPIHQYFLESNSDLIVKKKFLDCYLLVSVGWLTDYKPVPGYIYFLCQFYQHILN